MSRETISETQKCVMWAEKDFKLSDKPSIDPRSYEAISKLKYWRGELKNPKDTVLIEAALVDAFRAGVRGQTLTQHLKETTLEQV